MKTCSNCGVELEENMNFCPLCGEPVRDYQSDNIEYILIRKQEQEKKLMTDFQKLTGFQRRKIFWIISGIILFSGILATLLIDFLGDNTISWSKYSLVTCVVIFLNITAVSFWFKRLIIMLTGSFLSTSALLVILDIFHGNIGWGVKLGIPLLFTAYIIVLFVIILIKKSKKRGLNIVAFTLIAAGLLSICTEGIISIYTVNSFQLEWSLITLASVLPASGVLLFIHYKLKKGRDLRRFFHV